jgi:hypothetical protein
LRRVISTVPHFSASDGNGEQRNRTPRHLSYPGLPCGKQATRPVAGHLAGPSINSILIAFQLDWWLSGLPIRIGVTDESRSWLPAGYSLTLVSQTSPSTTLGSVTVEPRGVEPLTSRLQGGRSSQLSYGPKFGGSGRTRTYTNQHRKLVLYSN